MLRARTAPDAKGGAIATLPITQKASAARVQRLAHGGPILVPPPAPAWLTVADAARELRVCTAIVYRLCASGELAHVRVSNAIRIAAQDLAAYLERHLKQPKPQVKA